MNTGNCYCLPFPFIFPPPPPLLKNNDVTFAPTLFSAEEKLGI